MLCVERFQTGLFGANCYLLFDQESSGAVIVDPGVGAIGALRERLAELSLELAAVLLTHGHVDHVWQADEAAKLATPPVPVFVPAPDMWGMDDPLAFFDEPVTTTDLGLDELGAPLWVKPQFLEKVPAGTWQVAPRIVLQMIPARGHSAGSAIFLLGSSCLLTGAPEPVDRVALSGDVIFAGSVGRTDLVTGSETEMRQTLRTLGNVLDPRTVLLPGHGAATQWAVELAQNPYVVRALRVG